MHNELGTTSFSEFMGSIVYGSYSHPWLVMYAPEPA